MLATGAFWWVKISNPEIAKSGKLSYKFCPGRRWGELWASTYDCSLSRHARPALLLGCFLWHNLKVTCSINRLIQDILAIGLEMCFLARYQERYGERHENCMPPAAFRRCSSPNVCAALVMRQDYLDRKSSATRNHSSFNDLNCET